MKKENTVANCSGIGIIFGVAIGILLFIITEQPWHIGIVAGIGVVIGSAIGLYVRENKGTDVKY